MIDPKKAAEIDQAVTTMIEMFPPLWAGLYRKLTDDEKLPAMVALEMVKAFIQKPDSNRTTDTRDNDEE